MDLSASLSLCHCACQINSFFFFLKKDCLVVKCNKISRSEGLWVTALNFLGVFPEFAGAGFQIACTHDKPPLTQIRITQLKNSPEGQRGVKMCHWQLFWKSRGALWHCVGPSLGLILKSSLTPKGIKR